MKKNVNELNLTTNYFMRMFLFKPLKYRTFITPEFL